MLVGLQPPSKTKSRGSDAAGAEAEAKVGDEAGAVAGAGAEDEAALR
jgi:hypothetical protein